MNNEIMKCNRNVPNTLNKTINNLKIINMNSYFTMDTINNFFRNFK